MKLPTIEGRECLPVRLLPYLTAWQRLTPDAIAQRLSHTHVFRWKLPPAHHLLADGSSREMKPEEWENTVVRLNALEARIRRSGVSDAEQEERWINESVRLLPGGVFLWKDKFVESSASNYYSLNFTPVLTEDEEAAVLQGFVVPAAGGSSTHGPNDSSTAPPDAPVGFDGVKAESQAVKSVKHTQVPRRRDTLDPIIELAQSKCSDPKDTAEVWAQMQALAQNEHPPLLAAVLDGLKYTKGGEDAVFTRNALDKRLHPEKRRKGAASRR